MKQERWQRAFAQNDKDFKELFGVKKEIRNFDCDISSNLILHGSHKRNCVERPYQHNECSMIAGEPPKLRHGYGAYRQA